MNGSSKRISILPEFEVWKEFQKQGSELEETEVSKQEQIVKNLRGDLEPLKKQASGVVGECIHC